MSTTMATDATPSKAHVIRTLAKSLREYRTASLLSPLFVIVEAVIEIAIPTVIAILIDKGISGKSMPIPSMGYWGPWRCISAKDCIISPSP